MKDIQNAQKHALTHHTNQLSPIVNHIILALIGGHCIQYTLCLYAKGIIFMDSVCNNLSVYLSRVLLLPYNCFLI